MTNGNLEETYNARAAEDELGFFYLLYDNGQLTLYEGGYSFDKGERELKNLKGHSLEDFAKTIHVPRYILDSLSKDVSEINSLFGYSKYVDTPIQLVLEDRILENERKIALIAQQQGVDLRGYFKKYKDFFEPDQQDRNWNDPNWWLSI